METLTLKSLSRNPFRVLGLSAHASPADIDAAANRLHAAPVPSQIPPTPYDALWLGILSRNKDAIQQALAVLADPQRRLHARLFWFASTPPQSTPSATAPAPSPSADSLLTELISIFILTTPAPLARWSDLLNQASAIAAAPATRQTLLDLERQTTPAADEAHIDAALADLPRTIADTCFAHTLAVSGLPGLISLADSLTPTLQPFASLLWDQLAAALDALAARLIATLRLNLDRGGWLLKHDCRAETQAFDRALDPLALLLQHQGSAFPDQASRAATTAINILEFLADAWTLLAIPEEATRLLGRALTFSADTTVETTLRAKLTQLQESKSHRAFGRQ